VNMLMKFRVSLNVGKFLSSWATGGFSRRTQCHGVRRSLIESNPKVMTVFTSARSQNPSKGAWTQYTPNKIYL
jgi:hypothetical protein